MWIGAWIQIKLNRIHHTKFLLSDANIKYAFSVYLDSCGRGLNVEESIKVSPFKEKKIVRTWFFHLLNVLTRKKQSKITQNGKVSVTKLENAWQDAGFSSVNFSYVHTAQDEFSTGWIEKRPLGLKSQKELWRDCVATLIDHIAISNTSNDITARWPGYDPNC